MPRSLEDSRSPWSTLNRKGGPYWGRHTRPTHAPTSEQLGDVFHTSQYVVGRAHTQPFVYIKTFATGRFHDYYAGTYVKVTLPRTSLRLIPPFLDLPWMAMLQVVLGGSLDRMIKRRREARRPSGCVATLNPHVAAARVCLRGHLFRSEKHAHPGTTHSPRPYLF